jgi:hypothetical protein
MAAMGGAKRREDGAFVFDCERCGQVAAQLSISAAGADTDAGPLPGGDRLVLRGGEQPTVRLEFVNVSVRPAAPALVTLLANTSELDAAQVRSVDPELAAFMCRECRRNYCPDCWSPWTQFDDGFYDCTMGRCPAGHRQLLDD